MTHIEALKLALDALGKWSSGRDIDAVELNDLISTIEAALEQPEQVWLTGCPSCGMDGGCDCDEGTYNPMLNAGWGSEQPEQEPVAWIDNTEHPKHRLYRQSATEKRLYGPLRPLYTHPPRREWRGLTDDEVEELQSGMQASHKDIRTIEAALKEKNYE